MPTYGYQCTQCDNAFETVQKITEDPLTTCDRCGGQLRKKIFPVGISFKGSGFYVNDYAKSSGETKPAAAGTAAPDDKSDAASQDSSSTGDAAGSAGASDKPQPAASDAGSSASPAPAPSAPAAPSTPSAS